MNPQFLLVAATSNEIVDIVGPISPYKVSKINDQWSVLVTGVGLIPTTFHLTKTLNNHNFSQIVNVGLGGAINKELKLGQVVNVVSDEFAFWGSENNNEFLSVFDMELQNANEFPFENKSIVSSESLFSLNHLKKVNGLTVQTVTGSADSINRIERYYSADIESMEGAAVFYVAKQFNVPAIQLRAISNYVELRNRENWKIKEALASLSMEVKTLMKDC